jgi:hypothetical protein
MAGRKKKAGGVPDDFDARTHARTEYQELTLEMRMMALQEVRDRSLLWWLELVRGKEARGTLAARDSYHGALKSLAEIDTGTEGRGGITISIEGVDLSMIEDGRTDTES